MKSFEKEVLDFGLGVVGSNWALGVGLVKGLHHLALVLVRGLQFVHQLFLFLLKLLNALLYQLCLTFSLGNLVGVMVLS